MKHNPIIPMGELGRYLDEAAKRRREQDERDERAKNAETIAAMMIVVEPRDAALLRADAELLYAADIVAGAAMIPDTGEEAQIEIMLRMARLWRYAGGGT